MSAHRWDHGEVLEAALSFTVAGIALALGRNLVRTAMSDSREVTQIWPLGTRTERLRSWNQRLTGWVLVLVGLLLIANGIGAGWDLASGT